MRQSKDAPIIARLVNICWYFFKAGVAIVVMIAVATAAYLYLRMDDEIRAQVAALLADRYPQLKVSVGGARVVEGKGIAVYDLALATLGEESSDDRLLAIDELLLCCDVELTNLVQGMPAVHRVEVKRPQLHLRRGSTGRWNFESLLPIEPLGLAIPQIVVRGGVLHVSDSGGGSVQPLMLRDIELTAAPREGPRAAGEWPTLKIEGSAGGPQVRRVELHASVDGKRRACAAELAIQQLQVGAPLQGWIEPLRPAIARWTKITGVIDGNVSAAWSAGAPLSTGESRAAPVLSATLALSGGRLDDPRLSRPVTELAGRIVVDAGQLKIDQARGKWGSATVAVSLNRTGWAANAPIALSARVDDVPLDEDLYGALATAANPAGAPGIRIAELLRQECLKYRPTGLVNATLHARFDGVRWLPTAVLEGRQLEFESDKFAYRLTDGAGTIAFTPPGAGGVGQPARVAIDLTAVGGGQRLQIDGEVYDPRPGAAGWVEITGEGLEIDDRMIAALKDKPREVIASLHPTGRFNLTRWRIDRPHAGAEPLTSLRLDLTDVRINYEHFPYALGEIRGVIEAKGNHWTFTNLVSGGRRTIYGEGFLQPAAEGNELWLKLTGYNVPLDDRLYYALQPAVQTAWKQLDPRGAINLTAEVRHRVGAGKPNIQVVIQPAENSSLRPEFFPYLMDDVSGTITYNDGHVALHEMRARDDSGTTMGANGRGYFSMDGGWEFKLTGLWADRITARPALLSALPPQMSRVINQLRPSGTFRLHDGELKFVKPASTISALETSWDVQLECHQTDLNCGVDLHNVHGSVRLIGRADGQRCESWGDLKLETLLYEGIRFTNVAGPYWIDQSQCLLGRFASGHAKQPIQHITANVYGGEASGDGWVQFGVLPQYAADVALTGADLNRLMVERFGGRQSFQGKVDAKVMFSGEGFSMARLAGEGKVNVREGNIYELPLLMSLLKTLRRGAPDKTAFNASNIAFRIQGPHIYLDQIDFLGDVVDLRGYGEADFDQKVKLVFRGEFGPREYHVPFVKNLVGHASQSVMQMYVDGTLTDPHVTTEAFPELARILKQLRTDLETPVGAAATRSANRDLFGRETSR